MRITYVARSFLDYRVPVLAELDKLCGHQLHFISSTKWTPKRALKRLQSALEDRAILLTGEKSLGVDVPTESNTSFCIPYQPGLLRAVARTTPDVVIGDGFFQWTYAAFLRRLFHRTPLVICYERWSHTERNAQWLRILYRRIMLRFTDAVCCNGKLSAEYTASLGFPPGHITTGHMAADIDVLAARSQAVSAADIEKLRSSWSAKGTVFLVVGRLIKIKGIQQLLEAWNCLEQRCPKEGTLVIVGGGPEEHALKSQAQAANLNRVVFCGPVDYDDLVRYYRAADALLVPTLEDNWSLVVPEAMACGLPILCSEYNGCWPELVQEGRNGWVFDPLIPNDTLRVLENCVRTKFGLEGMGRESRGILKDHTPAKAAEAIFGACRLARSDRPIRVPLARYGRA